MVLKRNSLRGVLLLLLHLILLGAWSALAEPEPEKSVVHRIDEGGQVNLFLDDPLAQVHLLLKPQSRIIFAFPAENSGVGLWFEGQVRYLDGSLRSQVSDSGQAVTAVFEVLAPTRIETVLLDSLRVLRERQHQTDTPVKVQQTREESASGLGLPETWTGVQRERSEVGTVLFSREQPGLGRFSLEVATDSGPVDLNAPVLPTGLMTLTVTHPFSAQVGYQGNELYRESFLPRLSDLNERALSALASLEFLTRQDKMMAGSWRFLTYFGRDTLIALSMLEPILSDKALENGIRSVLLRLSEKGAVAHEEDIGPFAEWHHLRDEGLHSLEPVYDYKMIDDDLLLPILLKLCLEQERFEVVDALFTEANSRLAILKNLDYVLSRLKPEKPLRLQPGEMTGDWRDSNEGLGRGVYPGSVNATLAIPALDAVVALGKRYDEARVRGEQAEGLRPAWQAIAESYLVSLSPEQMVQRAAAFKKTLTPEQQLGFQELWDRSMDVRSKPLRFTALALDDNLKAVEIPSSDVCFTLFYGAPAEDELLDILDLLERPWPQGLMTPAGPLVANPVLSKDRHHFRSLGFGTYHGLVVWSWPSSMLQLGLHRQAARFPHLRGRLRAVAESISQAERRVGELANSELWAIELGAEGIGWRAFGGDLDETESNALQLWSTVYPVLWLLNSELE